MTTEGSERPRRETDGRRSRGSQGQGGRSGQLDRLGNSRAREWVVVITDKSERRSRNWFLAI